MSGKKMIGTSGVWFVIALVCMLALVAWLSSTSGLTASARVPVSLTFISPIGNPRLSLAKRVDNSAPAPGSQINYTLSYSNTNPGSQAFNVRLYDFLPAGVQFLSSNPPVTPDANGVLLFTAPSVGPGTEDHSVTVQARVLDGYPQLRNYGVVAADAVTPTYATLVTTVSQPPPGQLRVTKTGYPAMLVNGQLVYVLRCDNVGATALADVSLVDVLPGGVSLSAASPAPNVAALPLLRWSLGDLAPGAQSFRHRDGHGAACPWCHHQYGYRGYSPGGDDDDAGFNAGARARRYLAPSPRTARRRRSAWGTSWCTRCAMGIGATPRRRA